MQVMKPIGARVLVKDIPPVDEVTERAKRAGLFAVVKEENKPRATSGTIIAVGTDPMVQEVFQEGDTVFFSKFAGQMIQIEGKEFRSLDFSEIISASRQAEPLPQDGSQGGQGAPSA